MNYTHYVENRLAQLENRMDETKTLLTENHWQHIFWNAVKNKVFIQSDSK